MSPWSQLLCQLNLRHPRWFSQQRHEVTKCCCALCRTCCAVYTVRYVSVQYWYNLTPNHRFALIWTYAWACVGPDPVRTGSKYAGVLASGKGGQGWYGRPLIHWWVWFNSLLVKRSPVCWERLLTWIQFLCLRVCLCVCEGSLPVDLYLILTDEFLVRDVCRKICVQQGTEGQAVAPTAAEVGHIDVLQTDEREGDKEWRKRKITWVTNKANTWILNDDHELSAHNFGGRHNSLMTAWTGHDKKKNKAIKSQNDRKQNEDQNITSLSAALGLSGCINAWSCFSLRMSQGSC